MTISKDPLFLMDPFPSPNKETKKMRYAVHLYPFKPKCFNDFHIGFVVTDLPLRQWCKENEYKLVLEYKMQTRPAKDGEETDLD